MGSSGRRLEGRREGEKKALLPASLPLQLLPLGLPSPWCRRPWPKEAFVRWLLQLQGPASGLWEHLL